MKKVIVTDCDGVLLDWEEGFAVWMEHNGHDMVPDGKLIYNIAERYGMEYEKGKQLVKQFNQSAAMGFLPPLRDAQYYVKLLSEKHQYKFLVLTSLSLDPYAKMLRERNLTKIFGDPNFDLTATSSSTGSFSYTSDNQSIATISGNTITVKAAGSTLITLTQAPDLNYNSGTATMTLTVVKATPSFSVSNVMERSE